MSLPDVNNSNNNYRLLNRISKGINHNNIKLFLHFNDFDTTIIFDSHNLFAVHLVGMCIFVPRVSFRSY